MSTDALSGGATLSGPYARAAAAAWWLPLLIGIVNVVVGVIAIFWPGVTVVALAVLFGIQLLIVGVLRVIQALFLPEAGTGMRIMMAVVGVLCVLVGVLCLRDVMQTIAVLTLLLGLVWLISGMFELIGALAEGPPSRWTSRTAWELLTGTVAVLAGITVLVYPEISVTTLAIVLGIWLVIYGIVAIVSAFRLRSLATT